MQKLSPMSQDGGRYILSSEFEFKSNCDVVDSLTFSC
jgi:hypothetical protein